MSIKYHSCQVPGKINIDFCYNLFQIVFKMLNLKEERTKGQIFSFFWQNSIPTVKMSAKGQWMPKHFNEDLKPMFPLEVLFSKWQLSWSPQSMCNLWVKVSNSKTFFSVQSFFITIVHIFIWNRLLKYVPLDPFIWAPILRSTWKWVLCGNVIS